MKDDHFHNTDEKTLDEIFVTDSYAKSSSYLFCTLIYSNQTGHRLYIFPQNDRSLKEYYHPLRQ